MKENLNVLTIGEAAQRLGVSTRTVRREIAAGRLVVIKIRGCVRIASEDLDQYIRGSRCQSVATVEDMRPAYSLPADDLADLLGLTATRRSGRRAPDSGSMIVELAERRATRSRRRSTAG